MWRRLRLAGSAPARRVATYPRLAVAARAEGDAGSAASRRLRAAGRVPCAVYGVGSDGRRDRVLGSVCARDLWRELRARRETVENRAGKESEIPNFKGSDLGRCPLVSADFWTSDHLSERSRSMDVVSVTRARGTLMLKRT